jgi:hypothetical protein
VIFYTQNGCLTNRWFPTVENGALTADAFTGANQTLAPLASFAPKLLFPRGFAEHPHGTINGYFDPHDEGMGSKLTCAPIDPDTTVGTHWATSASLDHVAAGLVNPAGTGPLVLSVGSAFANVKGILSYSAPNTPYSPETNPSNVYKKLTSVYVSGTPTTAADYHIAQGNSILDVVKADLTTFSNLNMSADDKQKVSDWKDLLRQTEVKVVSAACNADNASALGITDATVKAATGSRDVATQFKTGGDMMIDLIALTMMCDTNRMIVLQWPGFVTFTWDGMSCTSDHHGLSHRNGSVAVGGTCAADVLTQISQIDGWYAGRYAKLVSLIDSIKEGSGTMLDNSAVMWLPELADGNAHNNNNLPIAIAGSMGGYLKQGQSINCDPKGQTLGTGNSEASCANGATTVSFNTGSNTGNTLPLSKLYVTLLNGLGRNVSGWQTVNSFGTMDTDDVTKGITMPGEVDLLKA